MTAPDRGSVRLTDEQRAALNAKATSVALGAGAGCGKTMVLTERFLEEIEGKAVGTDEGGAGGGRALRALVALTFTEKAARELRQRIRARCRQKLAAGTDDARWQRVLRALEAAPIGTFHQFCGGLLRTHALDLGLDPEFSILDATIAASLRERAVRTAMRRGLAERDFDLMPLGAGYSLGQLRENLGVLLASRSEGDLDAWTDLDPQTLVARWRLAWAKQGRPALLGTLGPAVRGCRDALLMVADSVHPRLRQRRDDLLDRFQEFESGNASDDLLGQIRALARIDDLREKAIWSDLKVKKALQATFEVLRKKIDQVKEKSLCNEAITLASAANSLRMLRLARLCRTEYEHVKRQRRGLDFDDLLTWTRRLLERGLGRPAARPGRGDSIEFILVDEFQDTDRVQSDILRLLGGDAFLDGRMFVVGDEKQSIYRFRGAEPAIFGRWRCEFPAAGRLLLTENFRSVPGIIDFVNALFADCFTSPAEEGAPVERPRLAPVRSAVSSDPAVTFFWAVPSAEDDETEGDGKSGGKLKAGDRRQNEARGLARWLRTRLDAGWTVVDRQTKELRRAHAGDVAFLFRAMTDVWPYETALADEGFDYHTLGGSAFFAQQEVRDVVNVLSTIEDPLDEVALAGALRSPFFSLSDDGLFWLARKFDGGLTEGIARAAEIPELTDRDRACALRGAGLLTLWRDAKDRAPLATLVSRVLDESGFEPALVCEFLGVRKLANTRKLVRLARDFDHQESFTLGDLVARLRADLDRPPREEQAATTDEQSPTVRLMSIHQAKGLEFPIVVIPDLNKKPSQLDASVGLREDLGLVVRPSRYVVLQAAGEDAEGDCLGWLTFQAIEADEERREAIRLFYVAATRARDHLVLSSGLDDDASDTGAGSAPVRAGSPAFQLLLDRFDHGTGRCLAELPDGWRSPLVNVHRQSPPVPRVGPHRTRQAPRPRFQEIEQVITRAVPAEPRQPAANEHLPSMVDLDPEPRVSTRAAKLDRLIRAVIADAGLLRGELPPGACTRVGDRQAPAAGSSLIKDAAHWLRQWPVSALCNDLREALRGRRPIERAVRVMLPWPGHDLGAGVKPSATVIRSRIDVIYLDRAGRWRPVIVGTQPAEVDTDLLRLLLAQAAANRSGKCPCGPAWWVHPDQDGELTVETRLPAPPATVTEALTAWLARRSVPRH